MVKKCTSVVFAILVFSFVAMGSAPFVRAQSTDMQPPTTPTGLSLSAVAPSGISLSWGGSTDNVGVAGYYVYRNGTALVSVSGTSFTDLVLAPGVYSYAVAAYDAAGNISQKSSVVSMTVSKDTMPPSAPTGLSVSPSSTYATNNSTSSIQVTLSWNASTDDVGVVGYNVYRGGVKITTASTTPTGTSYTDTVSLVPWVYSYQVSAYDASGNISGYSAPATFAVMSDGLPPSVPTGLSVRQTSLSGVTLSWASSTDNIGVAGYDIYRNGSEIGTTGTASYGDSGVAAGTLYSYVVAAYDAAGNVSASSTSATITVTGDDIPPSIPFGISAVANSSTVSVSWYPSSDAVGVVGYEVYRNGNQVATVASTSYLDTAPLLGENFYNISAYNVGGLFSQSSTSAGASWYPAPTGTTSQLPSSVVTPVPAVSTSPSSSNTTSGQTSQVASPSAASSLITASLSYGLRSDQVSALQSVLASHNYLASTAITGFFGNLTLQAVEKFQCDNNIACSGALGWGIVGPKTRTALNTLFGENATASSSSSDAALNAEIQLLQQELQSLEAQLK